MMRNGSGSIQDPLQPLRRIEWFVIAYRMCHWICFLCIE
ncbi:hypothetical protein PS880_02946 [Pseudomonas fluorescens]|uniref:Uncharacterized protein n=1 Tax=Pseudomonas fluorescens TaxID=294 RepID=A0A5E7KNW8_PSEFL|nr:hypothetical protein PS880_02946 [Pseudomonas fluorescens]